ATALLLKGKSRGEVFVYVVLYEDGKTVAENTYYLAPQKDMNFPDVKITRNISKIDGGYSIVLSSDRLARAVYLSTDDTENFFSDNYFDLIPGKSVTINVTCKLPQNELENRLKIMTYR
ncbi:MAG: glycoside hydrolase family 2 protein, partial [Prevotellaceae bacterium]|nr:glycoside hydrolase family 2 protein [Prevotellaceae bacterium]